MIVPWERMLRAALSAGIAPDAFWRLSLREWRWLTAGAPAMGGADLRTLMAAYPDKEDKE